MRAEISTRHLILATTAVAALVLRPTIAPAPEPAPA
ncbi:hypothetical protein J2S44_004694 [Catenuloplanes niger]|uniref:Uncharacterized protein n=1 Tax=Catenuloplanes niger TaxID=587534 RepID=A0AAE3ZSW2_9ACTN|nr:hypothetical protein [Catenuloplanes niger]